MSDNNLLLAIDKAIDLSLSAARWAVYYDSRKVMKKVRPGWSSMIDFIQSVKAVREIVNELDEDNFLREFGLLNVMEGLFGAFMTKCFSAGIWDALEKEETISEI